MLHHWLYQMCSRELAAVRVFNLIPWDRACCVIVWHSVSYYPQTQTKNDFLSHQIIHRNGVQNYAIVAACGYSFSIFHCYVIQERRYSLPAQFTVRNCPLLCITSGKYAMKEKNRERKYALRVRPYWTVWRGSGLPYVCNRVFDVIQL
jgi:hypothetical protein